MVSTLKCGTCTLRFDRPMLLPCGFTSCLRCLRRLAAEHPDYVMCPDCLKKHDVPDGNNVESFPVNKLIVELLASSNSDATVIAGTATTATGTATNVPRRCAPAPPPVKPREIEICSKCGNKTASFERCGHCASSVFCIFCFEKHIETISAEVDSYVAAVDDHCAAAKQIVDFYAKLSSSSSGMGTLSERQKRKEAVIEWGEQLKSLFMRAVGARVGQLCSDVDTMIDEQSEKLLSLDDASAKVRNIEERCKNIGQELRSSARPNLPGIFQTCGQVDEEIRSLEQSIEGLGMPYLDNDAVAGDTQRVLEEIKKLGKLVCDSKRTIQDIVAASDGELLSVDSGQSKSQQQQQQIDCVSFYEQLGSAAFVTNQDGLGRPFGAIWDMCAFAAVDSPSRYAIVVHNRTLATLIDAATGISLATYDLRPPPGLPGGLKAVDIKHVAVSVLLRQVYFSQSDKLGIFAMPLAPDAVVSSSQSLNEVELTVAVPKSNDSYFCGMAVDDRAKLVYVCDQFRSRVVAWSLETVAQQVALFPIAASGLHFDFKPFKCALSPVRSSAGFLLAVSDLTNERVVVLALSSAAVGQYLANAVISRTSVRKPCGIAFDVAGQLLVVESLLKRAQAFSLLPDCQSLATFPTNSDAMRSPRAISVFSFGPRVDQQSVAIADNAANVVLFYKLS